MAAAKESRIAPAAFSIDRYFEFSLLGLVASGYLALAGSGVLDAPSLAVGAAALAGRALMIAGWLRFELRERTVNWFLAACLGLYALDAGLLSRDFFTATTHLAFLTAALKLLTARRARDYLLVSVVGCLAMLFAAVLSASLTFFLFLSLFLVFAIAALASAEIRGSIRAPHNVARAGGRWFHLRLTAVTLWMTLGVFALTGGLFFILPRTAQAAFHHLLPQRFHVPGFSNEVRLGEIGEIRQRGAAVMHARIVEATHPEALKWRGLALTRFNGTRWFNAADSRIPVRVPDGGDLQVADTVQQLRRGERIGYEVQLNPLGTDVLFFAGRPEQIRVDSPVLLRTASGSYHLPRAQGVRYGASSLLEDTAEPPAYLAPLPPEERMADLELPPLDPRIAELARRVTAGAITDEVRAQAVENHLQRRYAYTTRLLSRQVPDPLAYFLFDRRAGHCEYFASAMAVMLRLTGIPARVATGFQTGVFNPVSGWWVIRAQDAHSWVEAWLPGRGWTTFDPTPPADHPPPTSLLSRLGFYLDAAETFWQEWVLNYNLDRQLSLALRMEDSSRSLSARWVDRAQRFAQALGSLAAWARRYAVALAVLLLAVVLGRLLGPRALARWRTATRVRQVQRGLARSSDATMLYERLLASLKHRGFDKPSWITPSEFARLLPASDTAVLVRQFTSAYNDMRFGGRLEAAPRMVELLETIGGTAFRL
jgi:transglutaminase-like putative cysteine protease